MTAPARKARKHPFAVRKQTSGYTFSETFIVVRNPGGHRVTVHAHRTREGARTRSGAPRRRPPIARRPRDDRP
jgi:hypothetical protein